MFKNLSRLEKEYVYVAGIIASLVTVGFIIPSIAWFAWGGATVGFITLIAVMNAEARCAKAAVKSENRK